MTDESTPKGPANEQEFKNTSMRDALVEAFEGAQKGDGEDVKEPAAEAPEKVSKAEGEPEEPKTEPKEKAASEEFEAPQYWKAEDKEKFKALPKEAQSLILDRHKEMTADYTRKTQGIAEQGKKYEALDKVFEPHRETLKAQGLDEVSAVRNLITAYEQQEQFIRHFKQNPRAAIEWLANRHGVNLVEDPNAEKLDPTVARLSQEVLQLKEQREAEGRQRVLAEQQQIQSTIDAFAKEIAADGYLAHPHFEELKLEMGALMSSGKAGSLQDAYDMALWANPSTRSKQIEADRAAMAAKREAERKEQVEKAKKASKSISNNSKPSGDDMTLTLRQELERQFSERAA